MAINTLTVLNYEVVEGDIAQLPVFMIHTTPLDSSYLIRSFRDIKPANTIITIDLPSHGKSEDTKVINLTFKKIADEIEKLRQELDHPSIVMYGHGVGGFVAQNYAIKYQKYLKGLILSNTAPNFKYRTEMAWNIRERFSKVTIQAMEGYAGKTDEKSISARFTQGLAVYFKPTNHDEAKKLLNDCYRLAAKAFVYLSQYEIPKHDLREKLRKIHIKTLIISGKDDVWPEKSSLLIKNDIIHARLETIASGHFPMIDNTQKYWELIIEWLSEIS